MMKLSLMQNVVSTVDEQWESPLADEIVAHWAHDDERAKYWRASTNFVFYFKHADQNYVLRFNHTDERNVDLIQVEVDYVCALADQGVRVARPVLSLSGKYVESVSTELGLFHAVAFEALPGEQLEIDDCKPERFVQWGRALGQLHKATAQITVSGRATWQDALKMVSETLPASEKAALNMVDVVQEKLSELPQNKDNFGLIHFDFELDNLIWDGDQAGLIDFDDSIGCWFVADIAFALGDLFGERVDKVDLQNETYLHFLRGYRRIRNISDEELTLIPLFLQVDNLITFARLYRAVTPPNPSGELPWMPELRDKLMAKMQFYREVLLLPLEPNQ